MTEYKNVIRTKTAIRQAFNDLVEEIGDVRKITVKELVDKADISKSTFYTHYKDINDVLINLENEAIDETISQIGGYLKDSNSSPDQYVHALFELFKKNESLYTKLFKCNAAFEFLDRLFDHVYEEVYGYLSLKYTPVGATGLRYEISFATFGTISMLYNYFVGKVEFTLDEIEEKTIQMFKAIASEVERVSKKKKKS